MLVALDARRKDGLLPGPGRDLESLELVDHGQHAGPPLALRAGGDVLPVQEETHELLGGHGLDLAPQAVLGVGVDARQQATRAPLLVVDPGVVPAPHGEPLGLESAQPHLDAAGGEPGARRQLGHGHRPGHVEMAAHDLAGHHVGVGMRLTVGSL